uniref:Non-selective voltage-gated ion channel VDAC3 n=1 Tax=Colobus angolensis palliatus TaxID=336983 RepID=A0A2K5HEL6_COLAP
CNTPTYCDLGKAAEDVFNKGYGFGMVSEDLKTKSCSGVEFSTSGHAYTDTGKASGNLETECKLAEGLKLSLDTMLVPNTGKKSGKLKASYKWDCFSVGSDVDIDFSGPTVYRWAALVLEGWLVGCQMSFDTAKSKLSQNNFAPGYEADGTEFGGPIYQKVNEIEMPINLAWTAGSNNTRFGIAAKHKLDCRTSLSAKANNASLIGLGSTQTLRPRNFNAGGHKVGLGFELEV